MCQWWPCYVGQGAAYGNANPPTEMHPPLRKCTPLRVRSGLQDVQNCFSTANFAFYTSSDASKVHPTKLGRSPTEMPNFASKNGANALLFHWKMLRFLRCRTSVF